MQKYTITGMVGRLEDRDTVNLPVLHHITADQINEIS